MLPDDIFDKSKYQELLRLDDLIVARERFQSNKYYIILSDKFYDDIYLCSNSPTKQKNNIYYLKLNHKNNSMHLVDPGKIKN